MNEWLEALLRDPSQRWVHNASTHLFAEEADGHRLPVTVNHTEWDSSYVCSPYTACVAYAEEELARLGRPLLQATLRPLVRALDRLLRWGDVNQNLHVNNWLVSTNLYPDWRGQGLPELHRRLLAGYPGHAVIFRSLNPVSNAPLMAALEQLGYAMLVSRQVYLFDPAAPVHQNLRRDLRLLDQPPYRVDAVGPQDTARVVRLYNQLYLEKYSRHNPHFSEALVDLWRTSGAMRMWGLRRDGRLDGVIGLLERNGVTTAPLVGYATELPQQLGLYRRLMALTFRDAQERGRLLNLSAGAAHFKRLRGGRPVLESSAVYTRHLSPRRRLVWALLRGVLNRLAGPLMQRYQV